MEPVRTFFAMAAAAVMLMTVNASAEAADAEPSATIAMEHDSGGIGIGWHKGQGRLTLKDGSEYAVTMDAYSVVGVGFANVSSTGKVYNLEKPVDLSGEYTGSGKAVSFGKGEGKATLKNNANPVRIEMISKESGVRAGIGYGSIVFKLGKQLKGPDAPPPVAVAPVLPPVKSIPIPVAIQKPNDYTLHFGFNKARVNLANRRVLDAILADWKKKGPIFRVIGHADMVGSSKYNMRLSQKRAEAVRRALIRKGVPATNIIAVGVGQKELAVPTKRGQRLRKNRRVTLTVLETK